MVEQPLRERPVVLLIQALHATGRQAEALRRARAFRRRLADESGLEPSPALGALEHAVAAGADDVVDPAAGRPLRGYVIHEAIGEGSVGRVYAATQPGTLRRVGVKAIRPDLADSSDFIRRFEAEAQLVARLEHPHIVPLYDYWREPGGAYLVFRLLGGGTALDCGCHRWAVVARPGSAGSSRRSAARSWPPTPPVSPITTSRLPTCCSTMTAAPT